MQSVSNRVILLASVATWGTTLWSGVAAADGTNAEPTPAVLSDADLAAASQQLAEEQIVIYDERPDKPFDRDTEVRLTGEQLAARGATDLATALSLLSDITVRDAGRGGFNIDVRGGRKGEVAVLVDGVLVTDPYYGTFDLSSIPITDIVQIRVSTTPQSPIDGPGGPGGVIEVHTRDAFGPQLVVARVTGDSLPSTGVSGTFRAPITDKLALRASASGTDSARSLTLKAPFDSIDQAYRDANGSARVEYREGKRRIALDGFLDDRHYINPPSESSTAFLLVDRETSARTSLKADDTWGKTAVQASAYEHYLLRRSLNFTDPTYAHQTGLEDLHAWRTGGQVLATRPITKELRWAASATVDREDVRVGALTRAPTTGDTTIVEAAADLQYEHGTVRLDGAVGVAAPFGIAADPWPEAKLVAKWRPGYGNLEISATGGRKGRVPSLRERFEPGDGNPALGPELDTHGEVRAVEHITDRVHVEVAPFYRHQTGTVRTSNVQDPMDPSFGKLVNLGRVNFYGADVLGRIRVQRRVEVGGGYSYVKAHSDTTGDDPLDRLPHHRWDAWGQVTPRADLTGLVRLTFFGESQNQGMTLAGYTQLEATGTWQITRAYMLVLRGADLTNTRPETRPGVLGAGRTVYAVFQASWD